jgi:hypothetical protein
MEMGSYFLVVNKTNKLLDQEQTILSFVLNPVWGTQM